MKIMEHNAGAAGWVGLISTFVLFVCSKILYLLGAITISQAAGIATIISASVVILANAPKALQFLKSLFKNKKQ
jgi:hypothetical protein